MDGLANTPFTPDRVRNTLKDNSGTTAAQIIQSSALKLRLCSIVLRDVHLALDRYRWGVLRFRLMASPSISWWEISETRAVSVAR